MPAKKRFLKLIGLLLLGVLVIAAGLGYFIYSKLHDEAFLRAMLLRQLQEHLKAPVKITGPVKLCLTDNYLQVEQLQIGDPPLAVLPEIRILFQGTPGFSLRLVAIACRHPIIYLRRNALGEWNWHRGLLVSEDTGLPQASVPLVRVQQAQVVLQDPVWGQYQLADITGTLDPAQKRLQVQVGRGILQVQLDGRLHLQQAHWALQFTGHLDLEELYQQAGPQLPPGMALQGRMRFQGRLTHRDEWQYHLSIKPQDCALQLPTIAEPLCWEQGAVQVDRQGLHLQSTWRLRDTKLNLTVRQQGWSRQAPCQVLLQIPYLRYQRLQALLGALLPDIPLQSELTACRVVLQRASEAQRWNYQAQGQLLLKMPLTRLKAGVQWQAEGQIWRQGGIWGYFESDAAKQAPWHYNLKTRLQQGWLQLDKLKFWRIGGQGQLRQGRLEGTLEAQLKTAHLHLQVNADQQGLNLRLAPLSASQVLTLMTDYAPAWLQRLQMHGRLGPLVLHLPSRQPAKWRLELCWHDLSLRYEQRAVKLDQLAAHLTLTAQRLCWRKLRGRLNGALLEISPAALDWKGSQIRLEPTQLKLTNFRVDPQLWRAIPEGHDIWDLLQPQGQLSLQAQLGGTLSQPQVLARIHCWDMQAIFAEIPYPLKVQDAQLEMTLDQLHIKSLQAVHVASGARFRLWGHVWPFIQPVGYTIKVLGQNIAPDQEVYQALFDDVQEVWEELQPRGGRVDIQVVARHPPGIKCPAQYHVKLATRGLSAAYQAFPYPVHNIVAAVTVIPGQTVIHHLNATNGPAHFTIAGRVCYGATDQHIALCIQGVKVRLDNTLKKCLPVGYRELWDGFAPQGQVNVQVNLSRPVSGGQLQWQAQVDLAGIRACYQRLPYPVEKLRGRLVISPHRFKLHQLQGRHGQARLYLQGDVDHGRVALQVTARQLCLDQVLRQALPAQYRKIWDLFQMQGQLDFQLNLHSSQPGSPPDITIEIMPTNCCLQYKQFAYALCHPRGRVALKQQNVYLGPLLAGAGKPRFRLEGRITRIPPGDRMATHLKIVLVDLPVDQRLRQALHPIFPKVTQALQPEGHVRQINLLINSKRHAKREFLEVQVQVQQLALNFRPQLFMQDLHGNVDLYGQLYQQEHNWQGQWSHGRVRIKKIPLTDLHANVRFDNNYIFLEQIHSKVCQGRLAGSLVFDTRPLSAFKGRIVFSKVALQALSQVLAPGKPGKLAGKLTGDWEFEGQFSVTGSLQGQGHITIIDGALWEIPLFALLCKLLHLPAKGKFHQGKIFFKVGGQQVNIVRMEFYSSLLTLHGEGTVDFHGNLDLTLNITILPKILLFSKIWGKITDDVLPIEIQGTFTQPEVNLKSLRMLKDLFHQLPGLGGSKK